MIFHKWPLYFDFWGFAELPLLRCNETNMCDAHIYAHYLSYVSANARKTSCMTHFGEFCRIFKSSMKYGITVMRASWSKMASVAASAAAAAVGTSTFLCMCLRLACLRRFRHSLSCAFKDKSSSRWCKKKTCPNFVDVAPSAAHAAAYRAPIFWSCCNNTYETGNGCMSKEPWDCFRLF